MGDISQSHACLKRPSEQASTWEQPLGYILPQEIEKTSTAIRALHPKDASYSFRAISLAEPKKTDLLPFLQNQRAQSPKLEIASPPRVTFAHYYLNGRKEFYRAYVDVSSIPPQVLKEELLPYTRHAISDPEEMVLTEKVALNNSRIKEEIELLNLPEDSKVVIDPWTFATEEGFDTTERTYVCYFFLQAQQNEHSNHYAYPLDFYCYVDSAELRVTQIFRLPKNDGGTEVDITTSSSHELPWANVITDPANEYDPELRGVKELKMPKPLNILQPDGPSFTLDDNRIRWMGWDFSVGFNYREGMTIHNAHFDGRSTFYRLSLSEMFVPYGDPRAPYHRKAAFDLGSNGAGVCANNLSLGCDCLGSIKYFDAYMTDSNGKPRRMPNVICCHEVDDGILWKHSNFRTGSARVVRSRQLVLQSIITVSNYEYIFAWIFDCAGAIHYEVRATGIMSTTPIPIGQQLNYGTVIGPGTLAPYHQHLFSLRIDPALDGPLNSVVIEESVPMAAGSSNSMGVGYTTVKQQVDKESFADIDPLKNRVFKIINPTSLNGVNGLPVGYCVVPHSSQLLLADSSTFHAKRSEFTSHSMWFTKQSESELYASGEWTNQSLGNEGIATWIKSRSANPEQSQFDLEKGDDLVVWHTFGTTHNPRTEDWPVMPAEKMTVTLKPVNFYVGNPGIDVGQSRQEINKSTTL